MTSFADDLNKIKAEETLKEKTKAFVRTELAKSEYERMGTVRAKTDKKENPFMKKILGAISAVAACALLAVGGFIFYNTPVSYVSVDINPSVELGVNAFGSVVSAQAYNDDGEHLLAGVDVKNLPLEDAVSDLVKQADAQGYIMADGSSVIAVTAESNNEQTAAQIQTACENTIKVALNKGATTATVYTDAITLHFAQKARELGVSPGKYKLIQILQSLDPSITVEQYKNAKISEIIAAGNALLGNQPGNNGAAVGNGNGQGNGSDADALQRIRNAALKAQKESGTIGQSGTVTIGESGNGNQNQNKNSNQTASKQEKKQEKEQKKEEKGNPTTTSPTTTSPTTPGNNGNGNGNGYGNDKNSSQCTSLCASTCSSCPSSCTSFCPSTCSSSGTSTQNGNNGANNGGKGKG